MGMKAEKKNESELEKFMRGKYSIYFSYLKAGRNKTFRDPKSEVNAYLPVYVMEDAVFTEPDGKLIKNEIGQKSCDLLLYFAKTEQTDFVEFKGKTISIKNTRNPYDQILETISYMERDDELRKLVMGKEKHAFIVSPCQQDIPRGADSKERMLWQKLTKQSKEKKEIDKLVHYVRTIPKGNYSIKGKNIICSPKDPVRLPM